MKQTNKTNWIDFEKTTASITALFIAIIIHLTLIQFANASPTPQIAENYYGNVIINGALAPVGTDVAIFSNKKMCARYVVQIEGRYGMITCSSESVKDLYFEVNGKKTRTDLITKNNINLELDSGIYAIPKGTEIAMIIALLLLITYLILKERKRRILK